MNFTIPFPPTTGNHQHGANGASRYMLPAMRTWRDQVQKKIAEERMAYGGQYRFENGRYRVDMVVAVPDARRRDLDNIAKVVLDAISDRKGDGLTGVPGVIDNDCRVDVLYIQRIAGVKGVGHVDVDVWVIA